MSKHPKSEPSLIAACRLRCIYCGQTPLRKPGTWFQFSQGCPQCDYRFEREEGYYTGASWMVNFPVTATLAFAGGAAMVVLLPNLAAEAVAGITSVAMLAFGAWFTPYSMAIWMFFEHAFHPLHKDDSYELPQESNL